LELELGLLPDLEDKVQLKQADKDQVFVAYSRARKQNHELEEVLREKAENETGNK
jgi:hypothetical protein